MGIDVKQIVERPRERKRKRPAVKTANIPPPHEPNAIDSHAVAARGEGKGRDAKSVLNDSAKREERGKGMGNGDWEEEEEDKRLSPTLPTDD